MSKHNLKLDIISVPIRLDKATDRKASFKQGIFIDDVGHKVSTIKALPKEEVNKIHDTDDIERVVQWNELDSMYPHPDGGFVKVNPKQIKKEATSKTNDMTIVGIIPQSEMSETLLLTGYNYYLRLQKEEKTEEISDENKAIYSIIYDILKNENRVIVVKYISRNSRKYGVIHATDTEGLLQLSLIYPSNLIRKPKETYEVDDIPKKHRFLIQELLGGHYTNEIKDEELIDDIEIKIEKIVEKKISGEEVETPDEEEIEEKEVDEEDSLFAMLEAQMNT